MRFYVLMLLAVCGALALTVLGVHSLMVEREQAWQKEEAAPAVEKGKAAHELRTLYHDGHAFIVKEHGGYDSPLLHHPGCPCLQKP